jgi:hypothetical protein
MTWLGKILTFVVMIGVIIWMYFTVQAYATRTNWKTEYETAKANEKAATEAFIAASNRSRSSEDALKRLLVVEQTRTADLMAQNKTLLDDKTKTQGQVKELQDTIAKGDFESKTIAANLEVSQKQQEAFRNRNILLEDQASQRILEAEKAKQEMVKAQNQSKLYQAIADDYSKKIDELQAKIGEMKLGPNLRAQLEKPPPPVLANLRGEVERVQGTLVELSIGADAGLSKGTVLDLSRLSGGGEYLGTVKVMDLFSKTAVAQFYPKRANVPVTQLRPEEFPKKGDQVRPSESSFIGR